MRPDPLVAGPLFGGAMAAFTERIWFIEAGLDATLAAMVQGHTTWGRTHTPVSGALAALLPRLEPWAMPSWKQLLVATDGPWTALFSQGSDVYTLNVAARVLRCRCLRTSVSPHVVRDGQVVNPGDCAFWLEDGARDDLGPVPTLRTIQASWQDRWDWTLRGEPQPFEDAAAYRQRRIPDRFTPAALDRCCRALGIRRDDPEAYGPRAVLIEQDTRSWPAKPRTLSAAEWLRIHR